MSASGDNFTATGRDQLRSLVERIERLEDEKRAIASDISEVKAEAKGAGFDVKVLNQVIRLRRQNKAERDEQEAIRDTYMHALGMVPDAAEHNRGGGSGEAGSARDGGVKQGRGSGQPVGARQKTNGGVKQGGGAGEAASGRDGGVKK